MSRPRLAAIVLLIASAALFAVGTSIEKNHHHHSTEASHRSEGQSHSEVGESAEHREAEERSAAGATEEGKILGIDRESTPLVVAAVLASLGLAALLWQRENRAAWLAVGLLSAGFAVFDVAEVFHQVDESQTRLVLIASVVGSAHVLIAAIAALSLRPTNLNSNP